MASPQTNLQHRLDSLKVVGPERVVHLVDLILDEATRLASSDVHLEPTPVGLLIRYRLDGLLVPVGHLERALIPNIVARLKVMAELLTYRIDIPQEGGIRRTPCSIKPTDFRVSTFPTIHGEKVVVRIFDASGKVLELDQLGFSEAVLADLRDLMRLRTGAILLTGPSGSGKTTTIYACLRHLVNADGGGRNLVSIEDPVEQAIEGVSQSQARPGTEFDFARGLRSLLRQDPEIIMIGEIRDRETAEIGIQAALTGHLVFSTLHAGSACGVIGRLLEMGIEPYLLTSSLKAILNQRLVRRFCSFCQQAAGCNRCAGTGYHGRLLLAELLRINDLLRDAILQRADSAQLEAVAASSTRSDLWQAADQAVALGLTSPQEILRMLGPKPDTRA